VSVWVLVTVKLVDPLTLPAEAARRKSTSEGGRVKTAINALG